MTGRVAVAHAPATIANVAVGFDVLGFALSAAADTVTVERVRPAPDALPDTLPVAIESIEGAEDLPLDPVRNTASAALLAMVQELGGGLAFRVRVRKGIPVGAGLGGSAASAVGAVVAANALLDRPLPRERLLGFAAAGEAAASGAGHLDNIAPCLYGGLCAALPGDPPRVVPIPTPPGLACVVCRPNLRIDTRDARAQLDPTVPLAAFVAQSAHLAAFVAACFRQDLELLARAMRDIVVGPQRTRRIPGFDDARRAALGAGAIGCAVAGSGPSVFAWVPSLAGAAAVQGALSAAFAANGLSTESLVGEIAGTGAEVVDR